VPALSSKWFGEPGGFWYVSPDICYQTVPVRVMKHSYTWNDDCSEWRKRDWDIAAFHIRAATDNFNNLYIIGPKGLGATSSLARYPSDVQYIVGEHIVWSVGQNAWLVETRVVDVPKTRLTKLIAAKAAQRLVSYPPRTEYYVGDQVGITDLSDFCAYVYNLAIGNPWEVFAGYHREDWKFELTSYPITLDTPGGVTEGLYTMTTGADFTDHTSTQKTKEEEKDVKTKQKIE